MNVIRKIYPLLYSNDNREHFDKKLNNWIKVHLIFQPERLIMKEKNTIIIVEDSKVFSDIIALKLNQNF